MRGGGAKAKRAMPKCPRHEFEWGFPKLSKLSELSELGEWDELDDLCKLCELSDLG